MDIERTEWLYLDRSGREFGPFLTDKMRAWFSQGFFPIGSKLLVRVVGWPRHVPVHDLYPSGEPFVGPPRGPGYAPYPGAPPPPCWPALPPPGPPPAAYWPPAYPMVPFYPPPAAYYPPPEPRSRSRSPQRRGRRRSEGPRRFRPHHSAAVPRGTDLSAKFASGGGQPTTAMLRNIPNKYSQDQLLQEIDQQGFAGSYDFFYLPIDIRNTANVGYAFINFLEAKDFDRFCVEFKDYHFMRSGSKKIATVSAAVVQGLRQNVENLRKKRVAQGDHGPVLLREGRKLSLDEAAGLLQDEG